MFMNICSLNVDRAIIKPNKKRFLKINAEVEPSVIVLSIFLMKGVRHGWEK